MRTALKAIYSLLIFLTIIVTIIVIATYPVIGIALLVVIAFIYMWVVIHGIMYW